MLYLDVFCNNCLDTLLLMKLNWDIFNKTLAVYKKLFIYEYLLGEVLKYLIGHEYQSNEKESNYKKLSKSRNYLSLVFDFTCLSCRYIFQCFALTMGTIV